MTCMPSSAPWTPTTALRLRPTDPQRIIRALEVFEATGLPLAHFQNTRLPPILSPDQVTGIAVYPDRPTLNARIDRRFDAMMEAGAMDEIARLAARDLDPTLPAMRALGVAPLIAALKGEMDLAAAVGTAKLLTRRYAKRQMTFARHQLPELVGVEPETAFDQFMAGWAGSNGRC